MDLDLYVAILRWMFIVFTVLCTGIGLVFVALVPLKLGCRAVSCFLDLMVVYEVIGELRSQGRPLPWLDRARRWHRGSNG